MKIWKSWHLFYAGDLNDLIAGPIHTYLNKNPNAFFIRYWEGGPHIRLRVQIEAEHFEKVNQEIHQHFSIFLKEVEIQQGWEDHWYPKGSIQQIPYEPETDRYAGELGLPISEEFFKKSSQNVALLMHESSPWSYELALGSAIQMQLALVAGLGMKKLEAAEYFRYFFACWAEGVDVRMTGEEDENFREKVFEAFEESLKNQREQLQEIVDTAWQVFTEDEESGVQHLDQWLRDSQKFMSELYELKPKINFSVLPVFKNMPDKMKLWFLYNSHSHMLNNRLGLMNQDEAFLGYILFRCLEA